MNYEPDGYYVIRAKLTWPQLDEILGEPAYGLQKDEYRSGELEPCGLSPSPEGLTYKMYADWIDGNGSRWAHVVLHPDGVCFSGSLCVEQDWALAGILWYKVVYRLAGYQKVLVEIHKTGIEENAE